MYSAPKLNYRRGLRAFVVAVFFVLLLLTWARHDYGSLMKAGLEEALQQHGGNSKTDQTKRPSAIEVQDSHPRLFASPEKWRQLPSVIPQDPYLTKWNDTIFHKAESWYRAPAVEYLHDGPLHASGVLDVARELQLRIKHWSYAYRLSSNPKWKNRIWNELQVASGNSTQYFGEPGDNWNTQHWLDVGEFLVAFAIAYDWLFDAWNPKEREAIKWSVVSLGLQKGWQAYEEDQWFLHARGNWNCVVNGGLIIGSLAVYQEDPTGVAKQVLPMAIENARHHCAEAVHSDGTWTETPDYWYFGTQTHAQLSSALLTATGTTQGMLTQNPAFRNNSLFHIYNHGMTEKFNYGDCGPDKLTATANSLLFYGDQYDTPLYTLYQRDKPDADDPLSILWYDAQVSGSWQEDLPLDRDFPDPNGAWVSMRSSWNDSDGLFVAMKAGKLTGHQAHGNLDIGDFVLDAMGERWASELCHDDYLSPGYFEGEAPNSARWLYYRCRTEGQNTLWFNSSNQVSDDFLTTKFQSTGTLLDTESSTKHDSVAFWTVNLGAAYRNEVNITRALRLLQDRRQVLIQDEIVDAAAPSQWRMHTKAAIRHSEDRKTARLELNGKVLEVVLESESDVAFRTADAARGPNAPLLPPNTSDLDNPGISVLTIEVPPGSHSIAVRFVPWWSSAFHPEAPLIVPISQWSLMSHRRK